MIHLFRLITLFFIVAFGSLSLPVLFAAEPDVAALRQEIESKYGKPKSHLFSGANEIFVYPQGRIILREGRVVENTVLPPEAPKPKSVEPPAIETPVVEPQPESVVAQPNREPPANPEGGKEKGFLLFSPMGLAADVFVIVVVVMLLVFLWNQRTRSAVQKTAVEVKTNEGHATAAHPVFSSDAASQRLPSATPPPATPKHIVSPIAPVKEGSPSVQEGPLLTYAVLEKMDWARLERLLVGYFSSVGVTANRRAVSPWGSVELDLIRHNETKPYAVLQTMAWHSPQVGIKQVRTLFGAMAAVGVEMSYFVTTGSYSKEALTFAEGKGLHLLDRQVILERINAMPESARSRLLAEATEGDFETPTCPRCNEKMVLSRSGSSSLWVCHHAPKCQTRFPVESIIED